MLVALYLTINNANLTQVCEAQVVLESHNPNVECISLIDDDLSFPRNLVSVNGDLWLVDKGTDLFTSGYSEGVIYRYQKTNNAYVRDTILEDLADPNDIAYRVDRTGRHWVYITSASTVFRLRADLDSVEQTAKSRETLIENIPTQGWHKLTAIELTQDSLYLTVPSATDHCESRDTHTKVQYPCQEADNTDPHKATALIRRYDFDDNDQLEENFTIVARGLRDALALSVNPRSRSQLLAADNGWDQIDLNALGLDWRDTPADELNIINQTGENQPAPHFGWPYCYANNQVTHPYKTHIESCEGYLSPTLLLPAHTAPLTMLYHQDTLLVNLHGPRPEAGRTIVINLNSKGLPTGDYQTLVDWAYANNEGIRGRPLGLANGQGNEIFITDDWDQRLMRVVLK